MKTYIFKVVLVGGMTLSQTGMGVNVDDAMLDACDSLAKTEWPEDDIEDVYVEGIKVEDVK